MGAPISVPVPNQRETCRCYSEDTFGERDRPLERCATSSHLVPRELTGFNTEARFCLQIMGKADCTLAFNIDVMTGVIASLKSI